MLTAALDQGWRGPRLTIYGTPGDLAAVPRLLCDSGSRPLARLHGSDRTLWVDVVVIDDEEPLDDIGQRVLRATVVAEDRLHVAISDAQRAGIAQSIAALIGRLRPDEPDGDHVHLEWCHPIDDPAVTGEHSPYIAWVFGIPPRSEAD